MIIQVLSFIIKKLPLALVLAIVSFSIIYIISNLGTKLSSNKVEIRDTSLLCGSAVGSLYIVIQIGIYILYR